MSRKYKTRNIDADDNGYVRRYSVAHVLQILRSGPDGSHGEEVWWWLMRDTFRAAYHFRDKKLFAEARKIFDREVWNTYYAGMLYDPKIHKKTW